MDLSGGHLHLVVTWKIDRVQKRCNGGTCLIIYNAYDVIIMPWLTEKSMDARTSGERLEFIVNRKATKAQLLERL